MQTWLKTFHVKNDNTPFHMTSFENFEIWKWFRAMTAGVYVP